MSFRSFSNASLPCLTATGSSATSDLRSPLAAALATLRYSVLEKRSDSGVAAD